MGGGAQADDASRDVQGQSSSGARALGAVGRLVGIARKAERRAPMELIARGHISIAGGLSGDHRGPKHPKRRLTVMAEEAWAATLQVLPSEARHLPWTTRRANLLVAGVELPRAPGGVVQVGRVILEVTGQTYPCKRMDEAYPGLLKALAPAWRGGVTCAVREGGDIALGDAVGVLVRPDEVRAPRLPG